MNRFVVDRDFVVGRTDPRLFGSFVEHLGRAVYSGLFEPGHPEADARGFRRDVIALVRELGVSVVRYPGGNFLSGYRWEDGVGPPERRPRRLERAWMSTESNRFGTNEFVEWCREAGVEPMMAVNLGTRDPLAAGDLIEYCNHPGGTAWSELRKAHGYPEPHDIRLWCLGNEMDGPWQMGHCEPEEYGRRVREAAKLMRYPDRNRSSSPPPALEFVACGSSGPAMPTFGHWERRMLEQCYDQVHHVSLHAYLASDPARPIDTLMQTERIRTFIDDVAALCDAVGATRRSDRKLGLSFDEWNVWAVDADRERWLPAWSEAPPLLEQTYTVLDALLVAGMGLKLLARADRVKIACLAQLVNAIAPIMTRSGGPAWRQTIFWPFRDLSRHGRGDVLQVVVREADTIGYDDRSGIGRRSGNAVDCLVVATAVGLTVFTLNRSDRERELAVELRATGALRLATWTQLANEDLGAANAEDDPDRVRPRTVAGATLVDGCLAALLPRFSWNVFLLDALEP